MNPIIRTLEGFNSLFFISMKHLLAVVFLLFSFSIWAQQPKMYLKVFGGFNGHTFVYRLENVAEEFFPGGQGGFGFRVSRRQLFAEIDFSFVRYGANLPPLPNDILSIDEPFEVQFNAFELPFNVGVIPIKKPLVKWYVFAGVANRFNTKVFVTYQEERYKLQPSDFNIPFYNIGARFGSQVDVAMFNFELNYTFSLNSAGSENYRTNMHQVQFNVGMIF